MDRWMWLFGKERGGGGYTQWFEMHIDIDISISSSFFLSFALVVDADVMLVYSYTMMLKFFLFNNRFNSIQFLRSQSFLYVYTYVDVF